MVVNQVDAQPTISVYRGIHYPDVPIITLAAAQNLGLLAIEPGES